jgi:hypothetical protein
VAFGLWLVYSAVTGSVALADRKAGELQSPLHGVWDVVQVVRAGTAVPLLLSDSTLWRRVVFPWEGEAVIVTMPDIAWRYAVAVDTAGTQMSLTARRAGQGGPFADHTVSLPYRRQDADRLLVTLSARGGGDSTTVHLRRIHASEYPLLSHRWRWNW